MRLIVIGAVAAGTSAAAKARRNTEDAEIVIYEKDQYISYSGCGMPYFLGGEVARAEDLTPRDPAFFKSKYNIDIYTRHEVLAVHPDSKTLDVRNLVTGEEFTDHYDKLILATGARSIKPPISGADADNVFMLRNINDMLRIQNFILDKLPQSAVIVGTGFIGLELCENLTARGIRVTMIEKLDQVSPGLDPDMAVYVEQRLKANKIEVLTSAEVTGIDGTEVLLSDGRKIGAELVILSVGVRPEVTLARESGLVIGVTGAIRVDKYMRTSDADIYACGDCIEQFNIVTNKPVYRPLGSTANKTGHIAGDNVSGSSVEFRGILGTGIYLIFGLAVAMTGLSEKEAVKEGYDIEICHNIKPSKPEYMGGKELVIKAIADRKDGRILGVQIVGEDGVDKRIDVFVTAITFGAKAEDLFHLDLAYAPPFSTTKDPVMYTGMILDNAMHKGRRLIRPAELEGLMKAGRKIQLIDTRAASQYRKSHVPGAGNIPHEKLRDSLETLDSEAITVTYCNKGVTGNAAQNILLNRGFSEVYNLSGGNKTYEKYCEEKRLKELPE
jgi:NADPH-dependent 2,4-dienoyl-CoA reductase/sulfur reductase-like enzyme/rhodanese-related sulfurtransferase